MAGKLDIDMLNSGYKQKSTRKSIWAYYLIHKSLGYSFVRQDARHCVTCQVGNPDYRMLIHLSDPF
ncbi:hypothetical protein HanIR_Chr11g0559381 [Helianthus annuus]|nr:hypothetical protein HanIR_Chr11g0559381 [Helianthus annuus]